MLSQNFDEGLNEFSGELDAEKLKEFVAKAARPNMFEFSDKVQGTGYRVQGTRYKVQGTGRFKRTQVQIPKDKKNKYFSLK